MHEPNFSKRCRNFFLGCIRSTGFPEQKQTRESPNQFAGGSKRRNCLCRTVAGCKQATIDRVCTTRALRCSGRKQSTQKTHRQQCERSAKFVARFCVLSFVSFVVARFFRGLCSVRSTSAGVVQSSRSLCVVSGAPVAGHVIHTKRENAA